MILSQQARRQSARHLGFCRSRTLVHEAGWLCAALCPKQYFLAVSAGRQEAWAFQPSEAEYSLPVRPGQGKYFASTPVEPMKFFRNHSLRAGRSPFRMVNPALSAPDAQESPVAGDDHSSARGTLIELALRSSLSSLIALLIVVRLLHRRSHLQ